MFSKKRFAQIPTMTLVCSLSAALAMSSGCRSDDDDGDTSTSAATTDTSTTSSGGTTNASTSVSSLAALPDIGSLFNSGSSSSLYLAVSGTPPVFSAIKPDTLETYLAPNITTLISNVNSYVSASNWDAVQTEIDSFRGAQCWTVC